MQQNRGTGQRDPTGARPAPVPAGPTPAPVGGTLKLGIVTISGDLGARFGVPVGQKDHTPIFQAVVDEFNATGGIAGRQVVASIKTVDQTDQSKSTQIRLQNQVCTALTEDDRVFLVIGGPVDFALGCYAQHRTPVLSGYPGGHAELSPWVLPAPASHSFTTAAGFVSRALRDQGFLSPRMGVVFDEIYAPSAEEVLIPRMEAMGGKVVDSVRLPRTYEGLASGVAAAVARFQSKEVDRVVFWAVPSASVLFLRQAEVQAYRPRYGLHSLDAPDLIRQFVPPEQLRGAVGAGWNPPVDVPDEMYPPTLRERACWSVVNRRAGTNFSRRSLRQSGNEAGHLAALWGCEALSVLRAALAPDSGRALEPAAVQGRMQDLGDDYQSVQPAGASFAPGKFDGGKHYAHLAYDAEGCACFRYMTDWLRVP